jgi:threonyl-tRNA synthetase
MTEDTDEKFFKRADAHIFLANEQLADAARGKVSASLMFAASRFNAWSSAVDLQTAEELKNKREEVIEYFMSQYRSMLEENIGNYIEHFDAFMNSNGNS